MVVVLFPGDRRNWKEFLNIMSSMEHLLNPFEISQQANSTRWREDARKQARQKGSDGEAHEAQQERHHPCRDGRRPDRGDAGSLRRVAGSARTGREMQAVPAQQMV